MKKFVLVFWALMWVGGLCRAESVTVLNDATQMVELTQNHLAFLEDPADQLSINNFTTNRHPPLTDAQDDVINMGHTASSIWARFTVKLDAADDGPQNWLLEIAYPLLQRVDIFLVSENRVIDQYQIGYARKMDLRRLEHRFFVQPLSLEPGRDYQVYVNVMRANGSVQLPLKLYRPATFLTSELRTNYVFGLFFGIMIAMIIYNLYLYYSVSDRAYLYYICYIGSVSLAFLTSTGYGYLLLWHDYPVLNEYALQVPSCLTAIFGLLFVRHFVKLRDFNTSYDRITMIAVAVGV